MRQRIRYRREGQKLISTCEIYSRHGARYMVYIDKETMMYLIRNVHSLRKYEGGHDINNMNVLKRKVREHLERLGCDFDKEVRRRSFGLCNVGYSENEHQRLKKLKQLEEQMKQEENNVVLDNAISED